MGLNYPPSSGGGGGGSSNQPSGGSTDHIFYENGQTVNTNYTLGTTLGVASNAVTAGPIAVVSGVTITIPSGSTWTVV